MSEELRPLVVRADAARESGAGHVMRCLALAQAYQDVGGEAVFAMAAVPEAIERRLAREGMGVRRLEAEPGSEEDLERTSAIAAEIGALWAVLDGYAFGSRYQAGLRQGGRKVLLVDDYGSFDAYAADIVLNQNVSADSAWFERREPHTRLLLGTGYAMLRREFLSEPEPARDGGAGRVLVTLGGSDPLGLTGTVVSALAALDRRPEELVVVLGPASGELEEGLGEAAGRMRVNIAHAVDDMPRLMSWAGAAISGCGSTAWELAYMRLPAALLVVAKNQAGIGGILAERGLARVVDCRDGCSEDALREALAGLIDDAEKGAGFAAHGRELVDGGGAARVIEAMIGPLQRVEVGLRGVRPEDSDMLRAWRNSPEVAAFMLQQEPISEEEHHAWFDSAVMGDPTRRYWVMVADGRDVGLTHLTHIDHDAGTASWHGYVAYPDLRGRGIGIAGAFLALGHAFGELGLREVGLEVFPSNEPAIRMYERLGFEREGAVRRSRRGGEEVELLRMSLGRDRWEGLVPRLRRHVGRAVRMSARGSGVEP